MKKLVQYFVDGTEVDFNQMLELNLIKPSCGGYCLTDLGKSLLECKPQSYRHRN
jgi:hypothetical protein